MSEVHWNETSSSSKAGAVTITKDQAGEDPLAPKQAEAHQRSSAEYRSVFRQQVQEVNSELRAKVLERLKTTGMALSTNIDDWNDDQRLAFVNTLKVVQAEKPIEKISVPIDKVKDALKKSARNQGRDNVVELFKQIDALQTPDEIRAFKQTHSL